jgi:hypothetical protein
MPQPQKAMPVAAAPVRKFLRVVIYPSRISRVSRLAGRLRQPVLDFFTRHIAKPKPRGQ